MSHIRYTHPDASPHHLTHTYSLPEEGVDGEEEEKEEEEVPTLAGALAQLGLTDLTDTFAKEKIDFDSFVSY